MNIVHMHLLLNHVPVVGAALGAVLLAYAVVRRSSEVAKLALALFAALAVVTVAVFFTGEPAEEAIEHMPGFSNTIVEQHEELALLSTIAFAGLGALGLAALVYFRRRLLPRWAAATGLALSLTISGMMAVTANLGGQIRHSEIRAGASLGSTDSDDEHRR
jgi:uncharacterized membrane protein